MKKELFKILASTIIGIVSLIMCYQWYDFKLFLILIAFGWANNIQQSKKK